MRRNRAKVQEAAAEPKKWLPRSVDRVDMAFGPSSIADWMPSYDALRELPLDSKWLTLVSNWFFSGIEIKALHPKEGIDPNQAMAHCGAIMRSWEPKHEHKERGVAWLLSQWFDDIEYTKKARSK